MPPEANRMSYRKLIGRGLGLEVRSDVTLEVYRARAMLRLGTVVTPEDRE